jgi:hypothetical protein
MEAAAHTKGGYGGVSQAVGKEFVAKSDCAITRHLDAVKRGDSEGMREIYQKAK